MVCCSLSQGLQTVRCPPAALGCQQALSEHRTRRVIPRLHGSTAQFSHAGASSTCPTMGNPDGSWQRIANSGSLVGIHGIFGTYRARCGDPTAQLDRGHTHLRERLRRASIGSSVHSAARLARAALSASPCALPGQGQREKGDNRARVTGDDNGKGQLCRTGNPIT